MPAKRVQIDERVWQALALLASDRKIGFQDLADEAFRDLLRKYDRPPDLRSALRQSLGGGANVHPFPKKPAPKRKRSK